MRNVLHIINGEHYSGAERVQDLLAMALPREGYAVGFVCLKPLLFPGERQARDAPLYEIPMSGRLDLGVRRKIEKLILSGRYELIHTHTPRALMIAGKVAHKIGIPLVHHVHSPSLRDSDRLIMNAVNTFVEGLLLRKASALIAVSQSLASYLGKRRHDEKRIFVVHNGVRPGLLVTEHASPRKEKIIIGMIALFRPRKGLEILLQAMAGLRSRGVNVELNAIGPFETQEYELQARNTVARLGLESAVNWTGYRRDVMAAMNDIDVLVLPSLYGEGLPMVVLEAMSVGIPVIGTIVEGVPEAIRHEQEGLLVPPADHAKLAQAIERMAVEPDLWRRTRNAAIARQAALFSDAAMAHGVARVYDHVMDL